MNPFEMVVLIVAIVMIASVIKSRHRAATGAEDGGAAGDGADVQMLADELRRLRDRVAVLERIATDGDAPSRLDREIEALRLKDL